MELENNIAKPRIACTPESVQEDNFENQIVLLDGFLPKKIVLLDGFLPKKLSWPKKWPVSREFAKIVLLDGCSPGRITL